MSISLHFQGLALVTDCIVTQ